MCDPWFIRYVILRTRLTIICFISARDARLRMFFENFTSNEILVDSMLIVSRSNMMCATLFIQRQSSTLGRRTIYRAPLDREILYFPFLHAHSISRLPLINTVVSYEACPVILRRARFVLRGYASETIIAAYVFQESSTP